MATVLHLDGQLGPERSFQLDHELAAHTRELRPSALVDLGGAEHVHPSVVSVLIRHQRQARRLGGELRILPPASPDARRTLDQIGLCRVSAS